MNSTVSVCTYPLAPVAVFYYTYGVVSVKRHTVFKYGFNTV